MATGSGSSLDLLLGFRSEPLRPLAATIGFVQSAAALAESPARPVRTAEPDPLPPPREWQSFWGRILGGATPPGPFQAARVPLDVAVLDRSGAGYSIGRAVDVSVTGLRLRSETPYSLGDGLAIRFRLPETPRDLQCGAIVIRISDDGAGPGTEYGIRFTSVPAYDRGLLEEFLARTEQRAAAAPPIPHAA